MNLFFFFFALTLICLDSLIRVRGEYDIKYNERVPRSTEIIEAIMNDPQFASLKPLEQIYILVIIYNKLESVLNHKEYIPIGKRLKGIANKLPTF
jgi:hypothetical protein